MNDNRLYSLLLLLGAAALAYYWSNTSEGETAIGDTIDTVTAQLSGVPRGIRNNNPGNIIRNSVQWNGALSQDQVAALGWTWDPTFVQFDSAGNGLRALARVLINYAARGDDTVDSIISTFAPPQDNDTAAYIRAVSSQVGVAPGTTINVTQALGPIMAAIVQHENGQNPYGSDQYVAAIAAASQNTSA